MCTDWKQPNPTQFRLESPGASGRYAHVVYGLINVVYKREFQDFENVHQNIFTHREQPIATPFRLEVPAGFEIHITGRCAYKFKSLINY